MRKALLSIFTLILALTAVFVLASCGKVEFNVDFVVDGEVYSSITTSGKETIKMPENPEKDGYTFDGWYWDNDSWQKPFTTYSLFDAPLSSDMRVYAKWKEICLHIDANDDSLCDKCGIRFTDGDNVDDSTPCQHRDADDNSLCDKCGESFEDGEDVDPHAHEYTAQNTDSKYLATAADCEHAATYFYSCSCGAKGTTTFTYGTASGHNYNVKNTDSKYLSSAATGTSAAVYYYSCVCGKPGTATFSYGEALNVPVESIALDKTDVCIEVGDSIVLSVMLTPIDASDRNITWVSSNSNVALVNNGVVIGVNPGVTTVIAMSANGKTASCRVEVAEKTYHAETLTLSDSSLEIRVGEYYNLTATITPDYTTDKSLVWSSSAPNVVKVEGGKITALAEGRATITATTTNGISASCTVTTIYVPVTEIIIDSSLVYVDAGKSVSAGITLLPVNATFQSLNYTSSNESVATVSNGVITAISDGITVITVSVDGLISKSFNVVVENGMGIKYEANGTGYTVLDIKNPQETVVIPKTYKGKTVNAISSNAFGTECSAIKYLYISRSATIPDAALTNCTQLKKLVLYGGDFIFPPSSDPYDFYRFFKGIQINYAFAPGDLRPGCGSWSHSWEYCDGTCAWYVTNPEWSGWIYNISTKEDWYWPNNSDYGAFFLRDAIIDWQTYNGYSVPKNIRMKVYQVPKSLEEFCNGYRIFEPECSTVCISAVDDLKIKFKGELLDIPLVSLVSFEDREKLHTVGTHSVTVYYGGFSEMVSVNVGHATYNVEENRVEETCTVDGHYDLVAYCSTCKTEVSRTKETIKASGHTPKAAVEENRVEATCIGEGSYDSVIYCRKCNVEHSRETVTIPIPNHEIIKGVCEFCGVLETSKGLIFTLNSDGKSYELTGKGTFNGSTLIINTYNGLPITSIGDSAVSSCDNLTRIILCDSITSIGSSAFRDCSSLTSVVIPNSVTSIGEWAFYDCSNLTSIEIPESVTSIGSHAFRSCSSLTSVVISDSVTCISSYAFHQCSSLTSIEIPESVTSIGEWAFGSCRSLTSIEIPDSVTSIGYDAFYSCSKLTSIVIGDSVTSIGEYAFAYCDSLTSIEIPDSVTSISKYAFSYCDSLTSVVIGNGVTSIGSSAFRDCSSLTSVVIGNGVTSIGDYAFYECTGLTTIEIPDSVTSIGQRAFSNCTKLTSINYRGTQAKWNNISKEYGWNSNTGNYTITYNYKG